MGIIDCSEKGNYLFLKGYKGVSLFRKAIKEDSKCFWLGNVGRLNLEMCLWVYRGRMQVDVYTHGGECRYE